MREEDGVALSSRNRYLTADERTQATVVYRAMTRVKKLSDRGQKSVRELIEELLTGGVAQGRLRAKLFGGACVLDAFRDRENHLGSKNVQIAREVLSAAKIPIVGEDVGGRHGRKLIFHTDNGSAWVREL